MALNFLLKRSGTASKRPVGASMALGEVDLNYDSATGGLFYKDSAGGVVKVGPAQVSSSAPNSTPAGSAGNSVGEFWYDTSNSVLKVWNGTSWINTVSTSSFLPLSGGTMTGNIVFNSSQTFSGTVSNQDFQAKGDLVAGYGANSFGIQSVGTNGQVLSANSATASGLEWVAAGGGASDATPTLRGVLYGCSGTTTTGVGCDILTSLGAGLCNTAVGCSVLSSIVNGGSNTAVGYKAGSSVITNGSFNVAMGSLALGNATGTGNILRNTAIGMCTLAALTVGSCNVAVGACSMLSQTSGNNNVAVGSAALLNGTTGSGNVAIGLGSLLSNSTAEFNIGVGYASMQANTTGTCNIAVGMCAHDNLDGGCNNVALGFRAGLNLSTGCYNVSIGDSVCLASPTGSCQLVIGFSPTSNWLTGDSTKAIKPGAGIIDCAASTGTAGQVLMSNGSNAICWGTAGGGGGSAATPTVAGIVLGCTTDTNSAVGCNALLGLATLEAAGTDNVAMGLCAGSGITNGIRNVALGSLALSLATNSSQNVAVGYAALKSSDFGQNVAVGVLSLCSLTSGNQNVALGNNTLRVNTAGTANTAVGNRALQNSTGCSNTGVGQDALSSASGGNNVAIGVSTGQNVSTGVSNTLLGTGAGSNLTTGCYNVIIGSGASPSVNSISCLYIGTDSAVGFNWLTGDSTKAIKPGAGIIDCAGSCGTAGQVLMSNGSNAICWGAAGGGGGSPATPTVAGLVLGCTTATQTALGCNALLSNTTGNNNIAVGSCALCANTTGSNNTATGVGALFSNTAGCCNIAVGFNALRANTTGNCNTAVGANSQQFTNTGIFNSSFGARSAVNNTTGSFNTAIGFEALYSNSTGGYNVAVGSGSMTSVTTGIGNTGVGGATMQSLDTGCYNVALGQNSGDDLTTGCYNLMLGSKSCAGVSGNANMSFGAYKSDGLVCQVFNLTTENDRIVMGSTAVTNAYVQVAWTVVSDARDKTNVTALPVGLDFVNQLNPVSFQFKESRECDTATGPVRYGFLAQEVLAAEGENPVIVDTEVPEHLKVTNDHFNAVLVKAVQELSAKIDTLEAEIKDLKSNS